MKKYLAWMSAVTLVLGLTADQARAQVPMVDTNLPVYRPVSTLSGEITIAGSDAMMQLAGEWVQRFGAFYPNVKFNLVSASSTRSVEAVRDKQAHFALMSREVLPEEIADFKKVTGHDPTIVISSMERIAVLVNAQNPVESLTLAQLDAIFAAKPTRGGQSPANWSALGTKLNSPVKIVLRDEPTGAPASFRQAVMQGAEFRPDAAKMDSYINVAKAVAADPGAISFAGNMYMGLRGTRDVPIVTAEGQKAIAVNSHEADNGLYPLVRPQHMLTAAIANWAICSFRRRYTTWGPTAPQPARWSPT